MSIRHDWTVEEVRAFLNKPFMDLIYQAQQVHRQYHPHNQIQLSTLMSVKTGACPEDCKYCPQSARYKTGLETERLAEIDQVIENAKKAKSMGSTRFCMGAAWKNPSERDMPYLIQMIEQVKELGLETCVTAGMLSAYQAQQLADAGLDYYNHNLDTSPEFYGSVITTRTYQDRLNTLQAVRDAGLNVCSGGIMGLGEHEKDRAGLLVQLANLPKHPESVPINMLVKVQGTPLSNVEDLDPIEFIKIIATARIMMPKAMVRLSAGRETMDESTQALCFLAGANSIFYGCKLLTTTNPHENSDMMLFTKLGLNQQQTSMKPDEIQENEIMSDVHYQLASQDPMYKDAARS